MSALVTCGETRAALQTVRGLGRAGIAVAAAASARPALALWSRYATTTLLLPDPTQEARRFAASVADEVVGRGAALALTCTDAALWALSRWRDGLPEGCRRVLPPHDAVVFALDRSALQDRARALGIACVETLRIERGADVEPMLLKMQREPRLPALVRPLVPWEEREDGSRRVQAAIPVESIADVRRLLYAREDLVDGGCVIEPRASGTWLGYGAVCQGGVVVAEVFQQRLRERGDLSGVSTMARTIAPDDDVRTLARTLLRSLGWQGPVLLELFRGDDGVVRLVNVMPRLWGSIGLALHADVNVPLLCHRLARGDELVPGVVARPGVTWRWLAGDLEVLGQRASRFLSSGDVRPLLRRRGTTGGAVDVSTWWRARPDVFDLDDPLPVALEIQHRLEERRAQRAST